MFATVLNEQALLDRLKNTVGYNESSNKEEFLKGAKVMFIMASDLHEVSITRFKSRERELMKTAGERYEDLNTISSILRKYSSE